MSVYLVFLVLMITVTKHHFTSVLFVRYLDKHARRNELGSRGGGGGRGH